MCRMSGKVPFLYVAYTRRLQICILPLARNAGKVFQFSINFVANVCFASHPLRGLHVWGARNTEKFKVSFCRGSTRTPAFGNSTNHRILIYSDKHLPWIKFCTRNFDGEQDISNQLIIVILLQRNHRWATRGALHRRPHNPLQNQNHPKPEIGGKSWEIAHTKRNTRFQKFQNVSSSSFCCKQIPIGFPASNSSSSFSGTSCWLSRGFSSKRLPHFRLIKKIYI